MDLDSFRDRIARMAEDPESDARFWLEPREVRHCIRNSDVIAELQELVDSEQWAGTARLDHYLEGHEPICEAEKPVPWIRKPQADIFIGCAIAAYACLVGIDVEIHVRPIEVSDGVQSAVWAGQAFLVFIFTIELVLRVMAHGWGYCAPRNPAGCFDTIIIVVGLVDILIKLIDTGGTVVGVMRLVRLFRLFRLARVLLIKRELRQLIVGVYTASSAVSWAFLLLAALMYIGALFCVTMLGHEPELQEFFGSVGLSLFTHFMISTQEAWPDVSDPVMEVAGPLWSLYFMGFICISSLAVMNLVTAVVCEKLMKSTASERQQFEDIATAPLDSQSFCAQFQDICHSCTSRPVNCKQFAKIMKDQRTQDLLAKMDIANDMEAAFLFDILDDERVGELSAGYLGTALLRLRGSQHRHHSLLLQSDVVDQMRQRREKTIAAKDRILEDSSVAWAALRSGLEEKLDELELQVKHRRVVRGEAQRPSQQEAALTGPRPGSLADAQQPRSSSRLARLDAQAKRLEKVVATLDGLHDQSRSLLKDNVCKESSLRRLRSFNDLDDAPD